MKAEGRRPFLRRKFEPQLKNSLPVEAGELNPEYKFREVNYGFLFSRFSRN
jgi:hypothetical protein